MVQSTSYWGNPSLVRMVRCCFGGVDVDGQLEDGEVIIAAVVLLEFVLEL